MGSPFKGTERRVTHNFAGTEKNHSASVSSLFSVCWPALFDLSFADL